MVFEFPVLAIISARDFRSRISDGQINSWSRPQSLCCGMERNSPYQSRFQLPSCPAWRVVSCALPSFSLFVTFAIGWRCPLSGHPDCLPRPFRRRTDYGPPARTTYYPNRASGRAHPLCAYALRSAKAGPSTSRAPPVCAPPPCPTRPVQVRVDVVIRPDAPKPWDHRHFAARNPPFSSRSSHGQWAWFGPSSPRHSPWAKAYGLTPCPCPCPYPTPSPAGACRPPSAPCFQPPPATRCMVPCPPPADVRPGPSAKVKAPRPAVLSRLGHTAK